MHTARNVALVAAMTAVCLTGYGPVLGFVLMSAAAVSLVRGK